jgi:hypothetical protein
VHLPKFSLETGGFRGERGFASVLVGGEAKISKDDAQPRVVFPQQSLSKWGELTARRTLEIGELFQRNRGLGVTADMRRGIASCEDTLARGNVLNLWTLCAIEHRAAPKRDQCDTNDDYKRQVAFHAQEKRRISTRQFLRQVPALLRFALCFESLTITRPREYSAQ